MNDDHFISGFADELVTKEAAHPMLASVTRGGTMLGRKVRGMMSRATKRGRRKKYRLKKKAEDKLQLPKPVQQTMESKPGFAPPKPLTPAPKPNRAVGQAKPMPSTGQEVQPMGKLSAAAGETIKKVLEQAHPDSEVHKARTGGAQVLNQGAEDSERYGHAGEEYGGGIGNFKGKKAPVFTDKVNPTDMPGAF